MSARTFLSMALAARLLLAAGAAQADEYMYFNNANGDGKYETTGNWYYDGVTYRLPELGDIGLIASGNTATLSSNVSASVPDNLYIGYVGADYPAVSGDGTLVVNNAAAVLKVASLSVGYSDSTDTRCTGTLRLSAGSISAIGASYVGQGNTTVTARRAATAHSSKPAEHAA